MPRFGLIFVAVAVALGPGSVCAQAPGGVARQPAAWNDVQADDVRTATLPAQNTSGSVQPKVFKSASEGAAEFPVRQAAHSEPVKSRAVGAASEGKPLKRPVADGSRKPVALWPSLLTMLGSLVAVLGLFFAVTWALRRGRPKGAGLLPAEAFSVLGRAPLLNRQSVQLLRCGNKLLLVAVSAGGMETLTEITDPHEVDRLAGLCEQTKTGSATVAFRQLFGQMNVEKPAPGFLGAQLRTPSAAPARPAAPEDDDV